jgi:hypothetical protein
MNVEVERTDDSGDYFPPMRPTDAIAITAGWAFVHGLATLLAEQRLGGIARAGDFADPHALVEAAITNMRFIADTQG